MGWDLREDVEREHPLDKWEWVPVRDPMEARVKLCKVASERNAVTVGEVRWFSEHEST